MSTINQLADKTSRLFQAMDDIGTGPTFYRDMGPGWRVYTKGNINLDCTWLLVDNQYHLQVKLRGTVLKAIGPREGEGDLDPRECLGIIQALLDREYTRRARQEEAILWASQPDPDPQILEGIRRFTSEWGFKPDPLQQAILTYSALRRTRTGLTNLCFSWRWVGGQQVLVAQVGDIHSTYQANPEVGHLNLDRIERATWLQIQRVEGQKVRSEQESKTWQVRQDNKARLQALAQQYNVQAPDGVRLLSPVRGEVKVSFVVSFEMAEKLLAFKQSLEQDRLAPTGQPSEDG